MSDGGYRELLISLVRAVPLAHFVRTIRRAGSRIERLNVVHRAATRTRRRTGGNTAGVLAAVAVARIPRPSSAMSGREALCVGEDLSGCLDHAKRATPRWQVPRLRLNFSLVIFSLPWSKVRQTQPRL
jgi:hypothetical protein